MKRLIKKKASFEYTDKMLEFIFAWWSDHDSVRQSEIEEIFATESNCRYAGIGYRWIELKNANIDSEDNLGESLQKFIKPQRGFASWSKTIDAVEWYKENNFPVCKLGVIISSSINGIDYQELVNEYEEYMDEEDSNYVVNLGEMEEEIIAKTTSNFVIEKVWINNKWIDL